MSDTAPPVRRAKKSYVPVNKWTSSGATMIPHVVATKGDIIDSGPWEEMEVGNYQHEEVSLCVCCARACLCASFRSISSALHRIRPSYHRKLLLLLSHQLPINQPINDNEQW